jgi:hypothetical protein
VRMMRTAISPRFAIRILENKRLPAAVFAIIFGGLEAVDRPCNP